jgi:peptide/nickel transport system substrate-binding protein
VSHRPVRAALLFVALLLALAVSGCASVESGSAVSGGSVIHSTPLSPAPGSGTIKHLNWWVFYRAPYSLDPVKNDDYPEDMIIENMCEGMTRQVAGLKIVPWLATSWKWHGKLKLVIELRHGVHFWNGAEMTSKDVIYSVLRNLNPKTGSLGGGDLVYMKNMVPTGRFQITVHFKRPDELFMSAMSYMAYDVMDAAWTQRHFSSVGTPSVGVMCTGPYKYQSWDGSTTLSMVRNPNYWNKSVHPHVQEATFVWPTDPATVAGGFRTGSFDGGFMIPAAVASQLATSDRGHLYPGTPNGSLSLEVLQQLSRTGPIANRLVRTALYESIDREGLAKVVWDGEAAPAYTPAPPSYFSYQRRRFEQAYKPFVHEGNDLAQARKLVKEAGPIARKPIVLAVQGDDETEVEEGEVIQQSAARVGLNIQIAAVSADTIGQLYASAKAREKYNALLGSNWVDVANPLTMYQSFGYPGGVSNFNGFNDPKVTNLINEAYATQNLKKQSAITVKVQKQVMYDMPWIPLLEDTTNTFMKAGITGAPTDWSFMTSSWLADIGRTKK